VKTCAQSSQRRWTTGGWPDCPTIRVRSLAQFGQVRIGSGGCMMNEHTRADPLSAVKIPLCQLTSQFCVIHLSAPKDETVSARRQCSESDRPNKAFRAIAAMETRGGVRCRIAPGAVLPSSPRSNGHVGEWLRSCTDEPPQKPGRILRPRRREALTSRVMKVYRVL
jgi:hypothetical protein